MTLRLTVLIFLSLVAVQLTTQSVVAVIGTNDLHGQAFPSSLSRKDTGEKYNYGGLVYMARLIEIIQQ